MTWARQRSGGYVCTPNVDYVVRSQTDLPFRKAILDARLRVPDGMWIVYASRLAGQPLHGTVTGRLLLPAVADAMPAHALRLALFGSSAGVAQKVAARLSATRPDLDIGAAVTPPYPLEIGSDEDHRLVARVADTRPDIVFVALGAPRQEIWMQKHAAAFDGAVLVGVGAAFDIMAGRFREAPRWMTRHGFEWAFRLAQEPRRLARRYLVDDPWIIRWALMERLRGRRRPPKW